MDPRKGLYSYEALQSRLAENQFAREGIVDYKGPVLRLANLSPEDLFVLLQNIRNVQAAGVEDAYLPDKGIEAFMEHCSRKIGDAHFRTPRSSGKAFVNMLAAIEQNPQVGWRTWLADWSWIGNRSGPRAARARRIQGRRGELPPSSSEAASSFELLGREGPLDLQTAVEGAARKIRKR